VVTGATEEMAVDLVIMALGNASNPIVKDAEPELKTSKWGTIEIRPGTHETSVEGVYTGGDANRGGSTAIKAAGDGKAAAANRRRHPFTAAESPSRALDYTEGGGAGTSQEDRCRRYRRVHDERPVVAPGQAGQFVRALTPKAGSFR
jgi:glutamate synthase (NADPH/NADH) small chain